MTADPRVELYLLRHADAGDPEGWRGPDEARPLSARGRRQAARLGAFLAAARFEPDAILTSPKVRARETATIVAQAIGADVRDDERLAMGVDVERVEEILADVENRRRVVLVGHDPDFSDLLADLTGAPNLSMRKGALARLDAERPLRPGGATLRWLIPPDALPREPTAGD